MLSGTPIGRQTDDDSLPIATERRPRRRRIDASGCVDDLHRELRRTGSPEVEAALLERYSGLAYLLADRLSNARTDAEDVRQAALAALVLALRRFDPDRGVTFTTFAWSTISGELKRFHRGTSWGMRVPRRVQEAYLLVAAATEELTQELARTPTITDLALRAELPVESVVEALDARGALRQLSLDAPVPGMDDGEWQIGGPDAELATIDDEDLVSRVLARLSERERQLVDLRFRQGLSQREVGAALGMSQMQVSRLLGALLTKLRVLASPEWPLPRRVPVDESDGGVVA